MNVAEAIKEAGGVTHVAAKLGVPRTTVQYWKEQNKVPQWRADALAKLKRQPKKGRAV